MGRSGMRKMLPLSQQELVLAEGGSCDIGTCRVLDHQTLLQHWQLFGVRSLSLNLCDLQNMGTAYISAQGTVTKLPQMLEEIDKVENFRLVTVTTPNHIREWTTQGTTSGHAQTHFSILSN